VVGAKKGEWTSSAVVKAQKGEWKSSAVVEAKKEVCVDHQRWWERKRGVDIISGGGSAKGSEHHQRRWERKGEWGSSAVVGAQKEVGISGIGDLQCIESVR
jgi:hypothetical protein